MLRAICVFAGLLGAACAFDPSGVGHEDDDGERVDGGESRDDAERGPHLGPEPIELGAPTDLASAGSYVLLAKTGITNAGGSSISGGHLGLSPAAPTAITGFALTADPSTEFATSIAVVAPARVYVSTYGGDTPANLTLAVLAMEAAYTDGAGRADPDFLEVGAGDLAGLVLEPGLYKWAAAVGISDDVVLAGGPDDVWIFQIGSGLGLATGKRIRLEGGARARNVFWVVAGEVIIAVNAELEGIVLGKTGITLQTTARMNGRALAQSLVAIDDNAIAAPI